MCLKPVLQEMEANRRITGKSNSLLAEKRSSHGRSGYHPKESARILLAPDEVSQMLPRMDLRPGSNEGQKTLKMSGYIVLTTHLLGM